MSSSIRDNAQESFGAPLPMRSEPLPMSGSEPLPISRRGFLRNTAGGAAAIAIVSALPAGCSADYPQAASDGVTLQSLTPREYAVARAAAEAFLADVPVQPSAIAQGIDAELAIAGDPMRTDMKTVLGLIEQLTFLGGRTRRFTALDPAARLAYLDTWARSRFNLRRGAYQALRGFVVYFAWTHPETRTITGFAGAWPERFSIPAYPVDYGEIA